MKQPNWDEMFGLTPRATRVPADDMMAAGAELTRVVSISLSPSGTASQPRSAKKLEDIERVRLKPELGEAEIRRVLEPLQMAALARYVKMRGSPCALRQTFTLQTRVEWLDMMDGVRGVSSPDGEVCLSNKLTPREVEDIIGQQLVRSVWMPNAGKPRPFDFG